MYKGERFNSWSHLLGTVAAIVGLVLLVSVAARAGDPLRIVSVAVYGTSLVLLYLASTLYHAFRGRAKAIFRKLDHVAIYLLIAGTYTPMALVTLGGRWGWTIFGVNWALALFGIAMEFAPRNERRILSQVLYLVMGWLALIAFGPLMAAMDPAGIRWLIAGGAAYTAGIVFYLLRRLPWSHEVFHVLVMAGSVCHFLVIFLYVR